jgi:murein DD-endopeptidase
MRHRQGKKFIISVCIALLSGQFIGCASPQPPKHVEGYTVAVGDKAASTALTMVGRPYKFKGDSPAGFDCSGLVRYSYLVAGIEVPHSADALKAVTRPVLGRDMRKGDLLFFTELGKKYSHVGIYEGNEKFVHAPSTGKHVRIDSLKDPYWKKHFLGARRFS